MKHTVTLILLCLGTALHAQTNMDSLLAIIESNNLELKAMQHDNDAAVNEMKAENTLGGPSVEYSPFYTKGYHGMASSELIVSQEFDFPSLYRKRKQQADMEANLMDSQYELRRREIRLQACLLFCDVIRQNQMIDILKERKQQGEAITSMLQKRLDAGDANLLELNKAKLEFKQTSQDLVEEENTRQTILSQICQLNGGQSLTIKDTQFPDEGLLQASAQPDFRERPEVVEAQYALTSSQHAESLARQRWLPTLSVGYRRNTEESTRLNGFLVGASFPLYNQASATKAARQRTLAREKLLEDAKLKAEADIQSRQQELTHLKTVLDHTDTALLHETLSLLQKAMEHGQINALQYYSECSDIYDKLNKHIDLHCKYVKLLTEQYLR